VGQISPLSMPFTPFHLGPALVFGLLLRRKLHVPTMLVASVAVDIEPLLVIVLRLDYPLHGYLHTLLAAGLYGLLLGWIMAGLEGVFGPLYRVLHLEESAPTGRKPFLLAGVAGTASHVLLDSPLYSDIQPFYPLGGNSLFNPSLTFEIYAFCAMSFGVAALLYLPPCVLCSKPWKRLRSS